MGEGLTEIFKISKIFNSYLIRENLRKEKTMVDKLIFLVANSTVGAGFYFDFKTSSRVMGHCRSSNIHRATNSLINLTINVIQKI